MTVNAPVDPKTFFMVRVKYDDGHWIPRPMERGWGTSLPHFLGMIISEEEYGTLSKDLLIRKSLLRFKERERIVKIQISRRGVPAAYPDFMPKGELTCKFKKAGYAKTWLEAIWSHPLRSSSRSIGEEGHIPLLRREGLWHYGSFLR